MVIKTASYRGLSVTKTCGLSDDYSCEVNATCVVKGICDGQHECNITVNDNLFSGDPCPRLRKYLYFEYQCIDAPTSYLCGMLVCLCIIMQSVKYFQSYLKKLNLILLKHLYLITVYQFQNAALDDYSKGCLQCHNRWKLYSSPRVQVKNKFYLNQYFTTIFSFVIC